MISFGAEMATKPLFDLTLTGQLSLDFVNTIEWRTSDIQSWELLNTYADLLRWGVHTGLMSERAARRLAREASRHPAAADKVLKSAILLRETLYRIFSAVACNQRPDASDLADLNRKLSEALSHLYIAPETGGYAWQWDGRENDLGWILWPVARAAGDLLVADDLKMLRLCPGDGCAWLFLDTSRNKSRRWCTMATCGNRAKARRHYEQVKADR